MHRLISTSALALGALTLTAGPAPAQAQDPWAQATETLHSPHPCHLRPNHDHGAWGRPELSVHVSSNDVAVGDTVYINLTARGPYADAKLTLSANGRTLALTDRYAQWTVPSIGTHTFQLRAVTASGHIKDTSTLLIVRDPTDTRPPVASIEPLPVFTALTRPIDVFGVVHDAEAIQGWVLFLVPEDRCDMHVLAEGDTAQSSAPLHRLNPSRYRPGRYFIGVLVEDYGGHTTTAFQTLTLAAPPERRHPLLR